MGNDMTLHLRCSKCDFLDVVLIKDGKAWKCPNCEFNQPERIKPEDFYQRLAKEYLQGRERWETDASEKKSIECFAGWLDRRSDELNSTSSDQARCLS